MVGTRMPSLVDVLSRLYFNHRITESRLKRREPKYRDRDTKLERAQIVLSRLTLIANRKEVTRYRDRLKERIAIADAEADKVHDDFFLHPFKDTVLYITKLTGLNSADIELAVAAGFDGYREIVRELRALDGGVDVVELYARLSDEHPSLSVNCGIVVADLAADDAHTAERGPHSPSCDRGPRAANTHRANATVQSIEVACRKLNAMDPGFKHESVSGMVDRIKRFTGTKCSRETLTHTDYYIENPGGNPRRGADPALIGREGDIASKLVSDQLAEIDRTKAELRNSGLPVKSQDKFLEALNSGEQTPAQVRNSVRLVRPKKVPNRVRSQAVREQ